MGVARLLWPTDISAESLLEKKNAIQESYIEITIKYIHTIYTYTHTYIYIYTHTHIHIYI